MGAPSIPPRVREVAGRLWEGRASGPVVRVVLGFTMLYVAVQLMFGSLAGLGAKEQPVPLGIVLNGLVIGSLYALIAIGLILVYRANQIINFAQAGLGAVPAVLGVVLMANRGVPYALAVPIAIVGGALLGALVSGVIEAFRHAPRLIVTVVTIGISLFLAVIEFYIPTWVSGETLPPTDIPTPLSGMRFFLGGLFFKGDHVLTVVVVGLLVGGLGAFFRYTDIGVAVRASAENADRASLLGIPVRRVSVVVWVIAAVLSAIGVFLRAPLIGLSIGGLVGPGVLLFGLAAAVIARMESLPVAFLAGMAMGVIDQSSVYSTRRPTLAYATMLVVILAALLLQRSRMSRAFDTGVSSFRMVREFRPIPKELRGLREVEAARAGLWLLVAGVAGAGPFLFGEGRESLASLIVIYAIVGVSLVILTGWAGQISLGQFAIAGIGAGVAGGLAAKAQQDFFVTVAAAAAAGALAAVLIGVPALRIRGLFLAVTTLAFAFTVENLVLDRDYNAWMLPADFQFVERPVLYGRFDTSDFTAYYYLCLGFLVLALLMARSIRRSRSGRVLMGVRENERTMQSFGVNVARTRLAAFAISGLIAGVAGALLAYHSGTIDPSSYSAARSLVIFVMVVIGGINSLPGAMLGAVYVLGLPELPLLRDVDLVDLLTSSVGLILVLLFLPGGFAEGLYRARDWYLRRVADKRGIVVPSLVADVRVEPSEEEEHAIERAEESVERAEETAELQPVRGGAS